MIRVRHETLPAGLSAIVRRQADGDLDVIVSTTLSVGRQRAAVRAGLRAMQPARRRAAVLPVPALVTLALAGNWLRAIARLLRLRPVATIAVAATAAAAVAIAAAPYLHRPAVPGRNPAGAALAPPGSAAGPTTPAPGRGTPSAPAGAQPLPTVIPVAARSPTVPPATSQPSPGTSAPMPTPGAPTPTPTPASGGGVICLEVLGLWVCV